MPSRLNFAHYSAKLLCDDFTTVRLHDGSYKVGQEREIFLKNQPIGLSVVTSICQFLLKDLPDTIAFPDCGGNAQKLKQILYRFYAGIHEESLFDVVTIHWTERPPGPWEDIFKNAWATLEEKFSPTLFNS